MKTVRIFLTVYVAVALLFAGGLALAVELEVDYPAVGGMDSDSGAIDPDAHVRDTGDPLGPLGWGRYLYNVAFALIGVVAFVSLVVAGIQWMTSRKEEGINDAKDRITGVILGVVLAGASFLILNLINPDLVSLREPLLEKPRGEVDLDIGGDGGGNGSGGGGGGDEATPEVAITDIQFSLPPEGVAAGEEVRTFVLALVSIESRFNVVVLWGDGNSDSRNVDSQPAINGAAVNEEFLHTWPSPGEYTATVVVSHIETGESAQEDFSISVQ